jgi:hypothetical protein
MLEILPNGLNRTNFNGFYFFSKLSFFFLVVIVTPSYRKLKKFAHCPQCLLMFKEEQGVAAT